MNLFSKTSKRDPWEKALSRHFASGESGPPPGPPEQKQHRLGRRGLVVIFSAIIGVLVLTAGVLGWVALENQTRGDAWQDRSETLRELVEERTQALNRQTARLNTSATRLRSVRRAVARSEADVASLEERQTELANEKAQLEDQRAALIEQGGELQTAASLLIDCNASMEEVLLLVLQDFLPSDYLVSQLRNNCDNAKSATSAYLSRYGLP